MSNINELKWAGLHERNAIAIWNLETISSFAYRQRKTKKTGVEVADSRAFRMQ
jgi:hypothetical protein